MNPTDFGDPDFSQELTFQVFGEISVIERLGIKFGADIQVLRQ